MRIFHFTESYPPYIGGVALSVEILKEELEASGHEVWIFAPIYPNITPAESRIVRFPSSPSPYPGFRIAYPFRRIARKFFQKHPPDIVHSHSIFGMGCLAVRLSREFQVPLVYTLHTRFEHYMHNVEWIPELLVRRWLEARLRDYLRYPKSILIPTQTFADEIRSKYAVKNIHPFYTAVRVPSIVPDARAKIREKLHIPEKDIVFLIVSRLSREKNIDAALEIFARIASERTSVHLLIVADGPERARLQKLYASQPFASQMHWIGAVPHVSKNGAPSVFDYYAASDAFLFTSLTETQGMVLSEAMAMGLVPLALRSPASEEILRDRETGILGASVDDLLTSVKEMIDHPEAIRKISDEARSFAQNTFGMSACASRVENVYRSVL